MIIVIALGFRGPLRDNNWSMPRAAMWWKRDLWAPVGRYIQVHRLCWWLYGVCWWIEMCRLVQFCCFVMWHVTVSSKEITELLAYCALMHFFDPLDCSVMTSTITSSVRQWALVYTFWLCFTIVKLQHLLNWTAIIICKTCWYPADWFWSLDCLGPTVYYFKPISIRF